MAALLLALWSDAEPNASRAVLTGSSQEEPQSTTFQASSPSGTIADVAPQSPQRDAAEALMRSRELAASVVESKQVAHRQVTALVDSGLAQEIADGMLTCAADQILQYEIALTQRPDSTYRYQLEFFLALWTEMASLLREGKVRPQIVQRASSGRSAPVLFRLVDGNLDIVMNTPNNWVVTMAFSGSDNPFPDLYKLMKDASVRSHEAARK